MTTAREATIEVQEKVLESLRVSQKAAIESVRAWATTAETFFSRLPDIAAPDTTFKPTEYLESAFAFTEKVLANQRDFAAQLFEAVVPPVVKGAGNAARTTAGK